MKKTILKINKRIISHVVLHISLLILLLIMMDLCEAIDLIFMAKEAGADTLNFNILKQKL